MKKLLDEVHEREVPLALYHIQSHHSGTERLKRGSHLKLTLAQ